MGWGQMSGVTGLRKRPSYTDIINAENINLPNKVQAEKDREFSDKTYALQKEQADEAARQAKIDQNLAWQTAHDTRKQQNTATNLGYANLGLTALSNTGAFQDLYSSVMDLF